MLHGQRRIEAEEQRRKMEVHDRERDAGYRGKVFAIQVSRALLEDLMTGPC